MAFTFLLGLGVLAVAVLACVNVEKSRHECRRYLEEEAVQVYGYVEKSTSSGAETLVVGAPQDVDGLVEVTLGRSHSDKAWN